MKKILTFIIGLFVIGFCFGNRDDSFTRVWRTNVSNPLNVSIEIQNTAPGGKIITIPETNLFNLANLTTDGSCSISRNSNNIDIRYSQSSRGTPPSFVNCTFYIKIHKNNIKNHATDYLDKNKSLLKDKNEEEITKIKDSINYGIDDKLYVTLKLSVDSNGNNTGPMYAFFSSYKLRYTYFHDSNFKPVTECVDIDNGSGSITQECTDLPQCSDGIDNDNDGKIDFPADNGCKDKDDNQEYLEQAAKPQCSDGIDNNGDKRIDYPQDPCCYSSTDNKEGSCSIQPDHKIPLIAWENIDYYSENIKQYLSIDNTDTGAPLNFEGTFNYSSDITKANKVNNYIPIGKVKILQNGKDTDWYGNKRDNIGISKFAFTLMNQSGTSPLSDNKCMYSGKFANPIKQGQEVAVFMHSQCKAAFSANPGKYSISVELIDEMGYAVDKTDSNNKIFSINNFPGDVDLNKSTIISDNSGKLGDINDCYNVSGTLKDSNGNIIKDREVVNVGIVNNNNYINEINNSGNPIWMNGTSTNINGLNYYKLKTDSSGSFKTCIYSYNKTLNNNTLNLLFNKIDIIDESPYLVTTKDFITKTINNNPQFNNMIEFSLSGTSTIQVGYDQEINLIIKNLSDKNILNGYFQFKPIIKDGANDVTKDYKFIIDEGSKKIYWQTGNETKNGGLFLGNILGKSTKTIPFKFRLEQVSGNIADKGIELGGELISDYTINNSFNGESKNVVSITNSKNILNALYWGVKVEGLSSSNTDFFKLTNNVGTQIQTTNDYGSNAYNTIKQNLALVTRGVSKESSSLTINGKISGINYTSSDIDIKGTVEGKSLVYSEGGDITIQGNIIKGVNGLLTIAAIGGKIIIDPSVTEINAIIVTNEGIFSFEDINKGKETITGKNDSLLKNQLVIKGSVISLGNTIGGANINGGSYMLPMGVKTNDFYSAVVYDLNFLRRYHIEKNKGNPAPIDQGKYGNYPVVIMLDSTIGTNKPYGL